ncbi:MATE family efflux transporter [Natronobacterium texcoconense]|uniref:Putative efflux protein, MATE family n=1 Tax=Natronobacterium texcoconense TaxID=1095778 RepID=A0A1H1BS01_NATTX|nr:MATE family efflux transporter [Natronobacterium texcoconense]SDQ54673.1 putative efflux protein, MATE family [Natronobacterium texcoconense]
MSLRDHLERIFDAREEVDLTSGGVARPLLYLSLPLIITNVLQTAYNVADTFWLGRYGTTEVAAISYAFPLVFLLISLALGLSVAGSVLVAQYVGADDESKAEYAASQTVSFSIIGSLILGLVGYAIVDDLLALFGAEPEVVAAAASYMRIYSLGLVFVFGFFMFVSLMRGYGDTVTPMLIMFVSVAINIALDPLLIFGVGPFPELGIAGAAYATIFARALTLALGLWIMLRGYRGVQIHLSQMVPDPSYGWKLMRLGLPASFEGASRALSINLLLVIVSLFATPVVAAYGIGTRILSVIILPAIALSQGVETMTGQNVGAGYPDRAASANRIAAIALFCTLTAAGLLTMLVAEPVVAVFTTDPEVIDAGATFLYYVAPTFGLFGVMYTYMGGFRGAGMTSTAAGLVLLAFGIVQVPVAWWASTILGPEGIWLSFAVSHLIGAVVAVGWFNRGTWRDGDLTGGRRPDVETATGQGTSDD